MQSIALQYHRQLDITNRIQRFITLWAMAAASTLLAAALQEGPENPAQIGLHT